MVKYKMDSDFDVNKRLTLLIHMSGEPNVITRDNSEVSNQSINIPNYCHDWADIGPLVDEYCVSIEHHSQGSNRNAYGYSDKGKVECLDMNAKRAAAMCIIKILENTVN